MKYFRHVNGPVYAFELDGSQDHLITSDMVAMTAQEIYDHLNPPLTQEDLIVIEDVWREAELIAIAAQLDALEEAEAGEPPVDLLPGTRTQWLAYRGKARNWKTGGSVDFPDITKRPARPARA